MHRVALVLDKDFGENVFSMAAHIHVWLVSSPLNEAAAKLWWMEREFEYSCLWGTTLFDYDENASPEEVCINIVETIDDHHQQGWSKDQVIPEWSELLVYGAEASESVRLALQGLGFCRFEDTEYGFRVLK